MTRAMVALGCRVRSLDVKYAPHGSVFFPVEQYDGVRILEPDATVDLLFSSNVLELPALLAESRRVLAPGGLAVHIVPSASNRLWSIAGGYLLLARFLLGRCRPIPGMTDKLVPGVVAQAVRRRGRSYVVHKILRTALFFWWPSARGEYANGWVELYTFSRRRRLRVFRDSGFDVLLAGGNELFYTMCGSFPDLGLARRVAGLRLPCLRHARRCPTGDSGRRGWSRRDAGSGDLIDAARGVLPGHPWPSSTFASPRASPNSAAIS